MNKAAMLAATILLTATITSVVQPSAGATAAPAPSVASGGGHMQAGANASQASGSRTSGSRMAPSAQAVPQRTSSSYPVRGIDVASYQGNVNWSQVAASGRTFALVKATEGTDYTNPYFAAQYGGAKAAGMYAGAYAFGRPDIDPVAQARYFLANAKYSPDGRTLPPMVDLEWPWFSGPNDCYNLTQAQMVAWIHSFVGTVTAAIGRPMIIYTAASWWSVCTGNSTAFGNQLLDVAAWQSTAPSTSALPSGWSAWTFWQFSGKSTVPGVYGQVDEDAFYGSTTQLAALAAPAPAPGTNVSVATLAGGGYEIAYQGVNGNLITMGSAGFKSWALGMSPGSSPAITGLAKGGYEVAVNASDGALWVIGAAGYQRVALGLWPGSSPAITALGTGYQTAVKASDTALWTYGTGGVRRWALGVAGGTSPSITPVAGGVEIALQGGDTALWMVGAAGTGRLPLGMMARTSPAIATVSGGWEIAFQTNAGTLWTVGKAGNVAWPLGLDTASSPDIVGVGGSGYKVVFQANNHVLWEVGAGAPGYRGVGMVPGTSPTISTGARTYVSFVSGYGTAWTLPG